MCKEYRHIQQYEEEMLKLKAERMTLRKIGERYGLSREQTHDFFKRYNRKQRKLAEGIAIKKKGQPTNKDDLPPSVLKQSKINQLKYELAAKERRIKALEMENELMRDFLSLTERK